MLPTLGSSQTLTVSTDSAEASALGLSKPLVMLTCEGGTSAQVISADNAAGASLVQLIDVLLLPGSAAPAPAVPATQTQ